MRNVLVLCFHLQEGYLRTSVIKVEDTWLGESCYILNQTWRWVISKGK